MRADRRGRIAPAERSGEEIRKSINEIPYVPIGSADGYFVGVVRAEQLRCSRQR